MHNNRNSIPYLWWTRHGRSMLYCTSCSALSTITLFEQNVITRKKHFNFFVYFVRDGEVFCYFFQDVVEVKGVMNYDYEDVVVVWWVVFWSWNNFKQTRLTSTLVGSNKHKNLCMIVTFYGFFNKAKTLNIRGLSVCPSAVNIWQNILEGLRYRQNSVGYVSPADLKSIQDRSATVFKRPCETVRHCRGRPMLKDDSLCLWNFFQYPNNACFFSFKLNFFYGSLTITCDQKVNMQYGYIVGNVLISNFF